MSAADDWAVSPRKVSPLQLKATFPKLTEYEQRVRQAYEQDGFWLGPQAALLRVGTGTPGEFTRATERLIKLGFLTESEWQELEGEEPLPTGPLQPKRAEEYRAEQTPFHILKQGGMLE